ncbi:MAG: hypothetical protein EBS05_02235 [Proteobacteria bacterium]|nr:hypothetical protein [Pseudomonadota bacterium]NDF01709.1 hypothetical protein [Verrucomicrobiota bacterium]
MIEPQDYWQKLARLARQAPQPPEATAPFGFAARVVTRWAKGETTAPSTWDVLEVFSRRGLVVAGALMVAVVVLTYDVVATPGWTQQYTVADATVDPLFEQ